MGNPTTLISVALAVHNEEGFLATCLESVVDFADEIVIVDGESTDNTVSIAKGFGKKVKVISTTNKANFHINKQMAIDACTGSLILQLDADECVDAQLRNFILKTAKADDRTISAWYLNRKNLFLKTWLRKGGQYPDRVIRLFWQGKAYLPQKDVHEQMEVDGEIGVAAGHLLHYSSPDLATYLRKFNTYTSFKALQMKEEELPINRKTYREYVYRKPRSTFFSLYFRHRGYVDGLAGFVFAVGSAWHHRVAYLKYLESSLPEDNGQMKIYYPTSHLAKKQAHRGVGRYGTLLQSALSKIKAIQVVKSEQKAEIVHYTYFDLFFNSLKKLTNWQQTVVTVHDTIPLLFPDEYRPGFRGRLALICQKSKLRKVGAVITDSEASKKDIVKYLGVKEEKVKVVYLAADPDLEPADESTIAKIRKKYKLPTTYVLYVGDINYNKNLPQLIKAMKFLPKNISLVMVGKNFKPAPIEQWQAIEEQLHLSEVEKQVRFLNNVDDQDDLAAIYGGALCYVQPSLAEGFGLPLVEAFSCGVPVICSENSSLVEVGGDGAV
ncbi:MAG: glycosyltransferase, partial [Pseudomonadales bacterium]|nr:glycosyltransferase [Pseudomonadales bacterium]